MDELPTDAGWQFEPKWNGFRCLAFRDGDDICLMSKSGKPLERCFPEVAYMLGRLGRTRFVLDGEMVVPVDRRLSFGALQARLHPAASRIARLSGETPAELVMFDCLFDGKNRRDLPLAERWSLKDVYEAEREARLKLSSRTENEPPRFIGKAPGGLRRWATDRSSEWQPSRPELVLQVGYDPVTDDRFRHGTKLQRWRPDKRPNQCRMEQLERGPAPELLAAELKA